MILDFQMNALTTVEMPARGLWRIAARTDDNLFSADLSLDVRTPALNIESASLDVRRDVLGIMPDLSGPMAKLVGVRVGPGMTKIVRGILGGENGSARIAELTLEAMEMLINAMTVPELRKNTLAGGETISFEGEGPRINLNDVVIGDDTNRKMAENPRLKDSCVAFRNL